MLSVGVLANVAQGLSDKTEQRDVLRVGEIAEVAMQAKLRFDARSLRESVDDASEGIRQRLVVQKRRLHGNGDSPDIAVDGDQPRLQIVETAEHSRTRLVAWQDRAKL